MRIETVEERLLLSVAPQLLKDINTGVSSSPADYADVGGLAFFSANDGSTDGNELWKSDGTLGGTALVKDIRPGSASSSPKYLTNVNGTLFFKADDGTSGVELWKSNGTAVGTVIVKDINPGSSSQPQQLTNVNGTLFFRASDGSTNGVELWKSDGTSAGTVMVKDIKPSSSPSGPGSYPGSLTNVNGTLFFQANDGTNGYELWKSDGTSAGTVMVKDIHPGTTYYGPGFLANVNGTLFFQANDGTNGYELWKSDGTSAGTVMVKDVNPSADSYPQGLIDVNGTLFFRATDGTNGYELWTSDGSSAGTVMVKDINPTSDSQPVQLTNVNGTLFFRANDGTNGAELWMSNGSSAGTVMVKDINPTSAGSQLQQLTNVNGLLFFRANDGTNGAELWKSDGSGAGTALVMDINPVAASSSPQYLTNVNGTLYFSADDGTHGQEPWIVAPDVVSSSVAGRQLFYNQSTWDGGADSITTGDDAAIATDKTAYIAGSGSASSTALSSFNRGINGVMVDLLGGGAHTSIDASDFIFKTGNDNTPSGWATAPAPIAITVRTGAGVSSSDRVEILWGANAVKKAWLEVEVLNTAHTGLASTDVFFWGNMVGDSNLNFATSGADSSNVLANPTGAASITNTRDHNRSTVVNGTDSSLALANVASIVRINLSAGSMGPVGGDGGIEASPAASAAGDSGIASGLSATAATARSPVHVPAWVLDRLRKLDPNSGPVADYFQYLANEGTAKAKTILTKADRIADAVHLDDHFLDSLLDDLGLE